MAWLLAISAIVFFGSAIGLAIWVYNLKKEVQQASESRLHAVTKELEARASLATIRRDNAVLRKQLELLQGKYGQILDMVQQGRIDDIGLLIDFFNGMPTGENSTDVLRDSPAMLLNSDTEPTPIIRLDSGRKRDTPND
jgi:hypothetical protein